MHIVIRHTGINSIRLRDILFVGCVSVHSLLMFELDSMLKEGSVGSRDDFQFLSLSVYFWPVQSVCQISTPVPVFYNKLILNTFCGIVLIGGGCFAKLAGIDGFRREHLVFIVWCGIIINWMFGKKIWIPLPMNFGRINC